MYNSAAFFSKKRFLLLYKKALILDKKFLALSKTRMTIEDVDPIVRAIFPQAEYLGSGAQKIAYLIRLKKRNLVLKIVKNISRMDSYINPYTSSGKSQKQRNYSFLKHYWYTKSCILQRYAKPVDKNNEQQKVQIKKIRKKFKTRLTDLRACNMGLDGDKVKILDALVKRC